MNGPLRVRARVRCSDWSSDRVAINIYDNTTGGSRRTKLLRSVLSRIFTIDLLPSPPLLERCRPAAPGLAHSGVRRRAMVCCNHNTRRPAAVDKITYSTAARNVGKPYATFDVSMGSCDIARAREAHCTYDEIIDQRETKN